MSALMSAFMSGSMSVVMSAVSSLSSNTDQTDHQSTLTGLASPSDRRGDTELVAGEVEANSGPRLPSIGDLRDARAQWDERQDLPFRANAEVRLGTDDDGFVAPRVGLHVRGERE